jgi:Thiol-disulfide isomerase and thioredoxins
MRAWAPFIGVIILALMLSSSCGTGSLEKGALAPDFQVESVAQAGKLIHLSDFKGKVVLIDFWATWCGPCRELATTIDKFNSKYGPQGLEVVAISNESRDAVELYKKEENHSYPLYIDSLDAANGAYHGDYIPRIYIVDRKGVLVYNEDGATTQDIEKVIQTSLNSK